MIAILIPFVRFYCHCLYKFLSPCVNLSTIIDCYFVSKDSETNLHIEYNSLYLHNKIALKNETE